MFDRGLAQTSPYAHLQNPASGNMAPHHLHCFPPQLVDDSVCQQDLLLQSHGFVLVLQQDQGTQGTKDGGKENRCLSPLVHLELRKCHSIHFSMAVSK